MRGSSWVAELRSDGSLIGWSGEHVEVVEGMVAEGAWAGKYSQTGFLNSSFRCGSGLVVLDQEVILLPPSHSLEGIYAFQTYEKISMSNSFHALIAWNPDATPTNINRLRGAVRTLKKGKLEYKRVLYETAAGRLFRFAFSPVHIGRQERVLKERIELLPGEGKFDTYAQYRDYLQEVLESLINNGRDNNRKYSYGPVVTTCSGGYDSAACAALGAKIGCDLALTVRTARGGRNDSGKEIAESLNIFCRDFERPYEEVEERLEGSAFATVHCRHVGDSYDDFLASVGSPEDFFFAPFAPYIQNSFLLTGFHGDRVWAQGCPSGEVIERGDSSGSGLDEFRKRLGFVHIPVPFIGAEAGNDIARISTSEEMREWWRGDAIYNRPVPRRIAEEAGVPRHKFGRRKEAASVVLRESDERTKNALRALIDEYRQSIKSTYHWKL